MKKIKLALDEICKMRLLYTPKILGNQCGSGDLPVYNFAKGIAEELSWFLHFFRIVATPSGITP